MNQRRKLPLPAVMKSSNFINFTEILAFINQQKMLVMKSFSGTFKTSFCILQTRNDESMF